MSKRKLQEELNNLLAVVLLSASFVGLFFDLPIMFVTGFLGSIFVLYIEDRRAKK